MKTTWVRIDRADNGWIVEYTERGESNSHSLEDVGYKERKKVFTSDEEDDAFEFFKQLKKAEVKS